MAHKGMGQGAWVLTSRPAGSSRARNIEKQSECHRVGETDRGRSGGGRQRRGVRVSSSMHAVPPLHVLHQCLPLRVPFEVHPLPPCTQMDR